MEIGAEVFSAELLFPDADFAGHMERLGIKRGGCLPETLVRLKHETGTTLSYAGLAIKAERLWFAPPKNANPRKKLENTREIERTSEMICQVPQTEDLVSERPKRQKLSKKCAKTGILSRHCCLTVIYECPLAFLFKVVGGVTPDHGDQSRDR